MESETERSELEMLRATFDFVRLAKYDSPTGHSR